MPYSFNPFTGNFDNTPTVPQVQGVYLPLSGGTITGGLSVEGDFEIGTATGTSTLYVSGKRVGINIELPNEELTVVGDVSATGVMYADGGNSNLWNNVYTSYSSASSNWQTTYNTVCALSAEWSAADEVLVAQVINADSVTLNRGDVVYTFGATGDVMSVKLASNTSDATSAATLGVINETIIPNGIGYVTVAGRMDKMSFPAPFADGDALWLGSTPGTFTRVKPVAPQHGVYLGVIERANNGNGIAYIKVQNGYELNEIHDVLIQSVSAGQILRRNGSNTLWQNVNDAQNWESTYSTVSSLSSGWLTTNYLSTNNVLISSVTILDQVSAAGNVFIDGDLVSVKSIFAGSLTAATVLYVDSNSKVGINTELPNNELTVIGNVSATNVVYASGGNSTLWNETYTNVSSNSATYVKTVETTTPGISAVTTIVAVSALPLTQQPGTLYILV
jgi:hypothetical protein